MLDDAGTIASPRSEHFGFRYSGFVTVPQNSVYRFQTLSDNGSTANSD